MRPIPILALLLTTCFTSDAEVITYKPPRVIVTTDGEADDQCSMVRYLLYSDQFRTRGLIYSSSKHHWAGDGGAEAHKWHGTTWIEDQLDAYAAVHPMLKTHAPFPSPEELRAQVAVGNIALEGDMAAETPGSRHIVAELLKDDVSPVWLLAWGGPNTIARALKSIAEQHPDRVAEVSRKARIYLISEQDPTFRGYIAPNWPELTTLICTASTYGAIAYRWDEALPESLHGYFSAAWQRENLLEGHGPLAAKYIVRKDKAFRSEGDSPSFMHLIATGIGHPDAPDLGGWGGRFTRQGNLWYSAEERGEFKSALVPWVAAFQSDFAARADWCVLPWDKANHKSPPVIEGIAGNVLRPGEHVTLRATATPERDGETFTWRWRHDDNLGTTDPFALENADTPELTFTAPDTPGEIHLLLEATDNGTPPLTSWRRVIFAVAD